MLDFNKIIEWLKEYGTKLILSIFVIFGLMILILIIKLISLRIIKSTDARGQKIVLFIKTVVKYLIIIFAAFIILAIWDFDTTIGVIIFSVFVFVIGISLVPLFNDIFSGINKVFSSIYKVGDIIEVNGYKGKVINFSLFNTQIQGNDGEVKTISNGLIKEVVNYSKDYITACVYIEVKELDRVKEIKESIANELPALKEEIRGIVEGPNMNGVEKFKDGVATLKISAKVKAEDYNRVMKGMQEYLLEASIRHKIK